MLGKINPAAVRLPLDCATHRDGSQAGLRASRAGYNWQRVGENLAAGQPRRWLEQLDIDAGPIEAIYFEEVRRHAGTDAAHIYGGLLAVLSAWCEEHLVAYQGVPVGTIKRFATGKGNADKAAVIDAIRSRGFAPRDDNEADALAILLWAIETRGGVR